MALTKAKLIADGVIDVDNLAAGHSITTSNIGEGSNLYYTDARVASYLTANSYATESFVTTGYLPLSGGTVSGNLTVTGSLTGTLATAAQTNITSVGTLSSLAVSGNATVGSVLAVNSDALYVTTGKNVGLGTSSPTKALQITKNNAEVVINVASSDTGVSGIYFGDQSDPIRAGLILDNNTDTLELRSSDNNSSVYLTSNERVGIGAATPSEKLEVAGNVILDSSNANIKLKSGVTGTKGDIQWTFNTDSTVYASAGITYDNRNTDGFLIDSGYPITLDAATGYIRFSNNGSERMRIDLSGNVGITTNTVLAAGLGFAGNTSSAGAGKIELYDGATGALIIDGFGAGYLPNGGIQFRVAGSEKVRIDASGNVGIGKTSPAYKLDVDGTIRIAHTGTDLFATLRGPQNRDLRIDIDANGDEDSFVVRDLRAGDTRFIVQAGGNVGIGVTPTEKLDVNGNIKIGTTANSNFLNRSNSHWIQYNGGSTTNDTFVRVASINAASIGRTISFHTNAAERMRIDSSGNVWIGVSPSRPLHVNSGGTNDVALFESTDAIARISIQDNTAKTDLTHNAGIFTVDVDPDNVGASSNFIVNVDGSEKARITNTGYLRMASGTGGLQFNGDTAAANALDDYEEGTWTPSIGTSNNGVIAATYAYQSAQYTKIGNTVFIRFGFKLASIPGGISGTVRVYGLPFISKNVGPYQEPNCRASTGLLATADYAHRAYLFVANNSNHLEGRIINNSDTPWNINEFNGDEWIIVTVFYNIS